MKFSLLVLCIITAGCSSNEPRKGGFVGTVLGAVSPVQPGSGPADAIAGGGTVTVMKAPEDPAGVSLQTTERVDEKSTIIMVPVERVTEVVDAHGVTTRTTSTFVPQPVTLSKTTQRSEGNVGPTKENLAALSTAKLNAMKPVQFIGIALILGALACFHPKVFLLVRSRTLQAGAGLVGVVLVILPTVVVGNERMLLYVGIGSLVALLAWYGIHRNALKQGFIDANKDGIDDRQQNLNTLSSESRSKTQPP